MWSKKLMVAIAFSSILYISFIQGAPNNITQDQKALERQKRGTGLLGCKEGKPGIPCCPQYVIGDMEGGSEVEVSFSPKTEASCQNACKEKYPTSVGVTLTPDESRCYCEFGPILLNGNDESYITCVFSTAKSGCNGGGYNIPYCPDYVTGDMEGGTEVEMSFNPKTEASCQNACKEKYPTSVGVTLTPDDSRCYCEFGPILLNGNDKSYKTCTFSTGCSEAGYHIPYCPEYVTGNMVGGTEFEISFNPKTEASCQNACKEKHPTSVGVTLTHDDTRCYCEFAPILFNGNHKSYKTCVFSTANSVTSSPPTTTKTTTITTTPPPQASNASGSCLDCYLDHAMFAARAIEQDENNQEDYGTEIVDGSGVTSGDGVFWTPGKIGDCWYKCGRNGDSCPEECGENGWCCRKNFAEDNCPEKAREVSTSGHHSCVIVGDDPSTVASENLNNDCTVAFTYECFEARLEKERLKDDRDRERDENNQEVHGTEIGGGGSDGSCFPAKSFVVLNGGEKKSMEHLHIGDVVMTVENGKLEPTTVLGFLDKKKNSTVPYLNLITEDGKTLFISDRHAMFIREDDVTRSVLAQDIKAGDKVIVNHKNGFRFSEVVKITAVAKTGAYVPLTSSGTLLVDGVLVSSYTNGDHWLAHMLITPLRWWPSFLLDTEESQDEEGIRTIPWIIRELATILGLATRAEAKSEKIVTSIFKMSQMTMTSIDKTEF